ncbi:MAG: BREX-3 system P-loop-containing protein BrxF, partial [Anaerolineales bacterium]|nr:BREX-3 system P-loop-containing protein BrxF [Anaerolineales bacterium]
FNKIAEKLTLGYINLGLELSQRLLNLTERQRILHLSQVVEQIISKFSKETPVILDHIEVLFDPSLKVDPLRLLQGISRDRTLIAVWKGHITNVYLTYAIPEHPEYHKYPIQDLNFINADDLST